VKERSASSTAGSGLNGSTAQLPVAILGIPIDGGSIAEAVGVATAAVATGRPHHVVGTDVEAVLAAQSDEELRRFLFGADLVLTGDPLLRMAAQVLGRRAVLGHPLDFVASLLQAAASRSWRVFLLGDDAGTVIRANAGAAAGFPGLNMHGAFSPAGVSLLEMPHQDLKNQIRVHSPEILIVDLASPTREKWIGMNRQALGVPLYVGIEGVAAWLEALGPSAAKARAGLTPSNAAAARRRFFRRWGRDIWRFGAAVAHSGWHLRQRRRASAAQVRSHVERLSDASVEVLRAPAHLDIVAVDAGGDLWSRLQSNSGHLVVDLSAVETLDSSGVGLLIRLQRNTRAAGSQFALLAPSPAAVRILASLRCEAVFPTAPDLDTACRLVTHRSAEALVVVTMGIPDPQEPLAWQGEVTAANTPDVWRMTEVHLQHSVGRHRVVRINLAEVRFIDSAGVAMMVRARRFATRHGFTLTFSSPQPRVLGVIRALQLEAYLLTGGD
jgi:N-acetylglucosaminyldiphosphoundecaprenol N-acetyl-beta-D-mannosaminyltransferase